MNIGFCGASGAGKTTLAEALRARLSGMTARYSLSASVANEVFMRYGYRQGDNLSELQRLHLQDQILERQIDAYRDDLLVGRRSRFYEGFIADRTPIDMAAYTIQNCGQGMYRDHAIAYARRCAGVTRSTFDKVIYIPSCIPYVDDPKRPPHDPTKLMHFKNHLLRLLKDFEIPFVEMPEITDLDARVAWVQTLLQN